MHIDEQKLKKEIVALLGLEKLSAEQQDALIDKAVTALFERVFLETMKKLGEVGVRDYEALMEKEADPEDVEQFLEKRISGYNEFVQNLVTRFQEELKKAGTP